MKQLNNLTNLEKLDCILRAFKNENFSIKSSDACNSLKNQTISKLQDIIKDIRVEQVKLKKSQAKIEVMNSQELTVFCISLIDNSSREYTQTELKCELTAFFKGLEKDAREYIQLSLMGLKKKNEIKTLGALMNFMINENRKYIQNSF